jgi:hypothetical protein
MFDAWCSAAIVAIKNVTTTLAVTATRIPAERIAGLRSIVNQSCQPPRAGTSAGYLGSSERCHGDRIR